FTLTARVLRDGVELAKASADGRAASYREEIGRRFDVVKVTASQAGVDIGPEATPRELRDVLARRNPKLRPALEEMVAALEVALYAEEEVGRDTYEALVRALQEIE